MMPTNSEIIESVSVHLAPPPCERSFSVAMRDGEPYGIEIDGVYYRTRRMKTSWGIMDIDKTVRLVGVRIRPDDA
jgi:hypothetical protein